MSDLNIQLILRLVDRATAPARAAMAGINRLGAGVMQRAQAAQTQATALAGALGGAAGAATRTGVALGLVGGLSLRSFTNQAAQFERFNVQLTNLEGSSEGASRAMAWIEDFATRTPLQVEETVSAYTRLRAFGIDPTNGTMQALVDTMAATGGTAEQLDGLVLALGQSWTKGKLQGEEALQMLERGVPVYDLLAEKLGVTTEEIVRMQSAGELGREEIALLIEAMGEANEGAAEDMSKTWDGIVSNLWDHWSRFQRQVMASDLFKWMKSRLIDLLDTLNRLAADGTLLRWAQETAATVISIFEGIMSFGRGVANVWNDWSPTINAIVEALGGMDGAIAALIALRFAPWLWAAAIGAGRLYLALVPFGWALALIGTAVFAIYRNWDGFLGYFKEKIDAVKSAFEDGLINGVFLTLMSLNPFVFMMDGANAFLEFITGWTFTELSAALAPFIGFDPFASITMAGVRFHTWITSLTYEGVKTALIEAFTIDLYQLGVDMMNSLLEGIKSMMGGVVAYVQESLGGIIAPNLTVDVPQGAVGAALSNPSMDRATGGQRQKDDEIGRAAGGPVRAGMIYRWQENGEEWFRPAVDGTVINAQGVRAMQAKLPDWAQDGAGSAAREQLAPAFQAAVPTWAQDAIEPAALPSFAPAAAPIMAQNRAPAETSGARTSTVNLGGITINAAAGMSPDAIARAVRREFARLTEGAGTELHDGGLYDR